jgi:UDP-N-acetylmuramate dehydrogenase
MLSLASFTGLKGRVRERQPLADLAYYRIGGPADFLVEPEGEEDVVKVMELAAREGVPLTLLGSGTNLLIRDGGIRGVVLYLGPGRACLPKLLADEVDFVRLRVPAWMPKAELLDVALQKAWAGLEFSAGIPGTLGGAVFMNAGTKWGSYAEVIETVRFYSVEKGHYEKTCEEMGFKYRGHGEGLLDGRTAVLSVDLKLRKDKSREEIRALVDEILCYRGARQPLELPNCGSVFKNPASSERGAGRLIEAAQLKGLRVGQAQVSLKHANFILNLGGAKAADVEALIARVQDEVLKQQGVQLEREVIYLGDPA